jgi:predicted PurR-regulated permease PerM
MNLKGKVTFWVGIAVAAGFVLFILRDVLLPFVAALALAYMLNPVANRLERIGVSRALSAAVILIIFLIVFITTLIVLIPLLGTQLFAFIRALPAHLTQLFDIAQAALAEMDDNPVAVHLVERMRNARQDIGMLVGQGAGWMGTFVNSLWSGGQALVSLLGLVIIAPIVAFYILVDWPRMIRLVDSWLPLKQADTIRALAREIDTAIAAFIRGQASVCLVLAIFYGTTLTVMGLNFGLLIGVGAGLISFIPYVGTLVGLVVSIGVGLVQFGPDAMKLGMIAAIFFAGQMIDGYVLQPNLVGKSVGLHPVWLMFALFAFASLFGFVGLLIAVPLAAAVGVLVRFALKRYLASPFYTGVTPANALTNEPDIVDRRDG